MSSATRIRALQVKPNPTYRLDDEYTIITESPSGAEGEFWSILRRIKDSNESFLPFVQCSICNQLLTYKPQNGTTTISGHVANGLKSSAVKTTTNSIDKYMKKDLKVTPDEKRSITIACAKYCAFDMRLFNSVEGKSLSFQLLCKSLVDLGYRYGTAKIGIPTQTRHKRA
ncbi:unnamed protein product [Didymodactylos carnosus]|uniref:BED-type domain-containing protein n=1 Tax=Didymodactylos carnosus TaxID=1234261 RepID=A0A8S2FGI2_9BILA|nr:unnamed protein product [Didymodactylos carnosus]CAF4250448.1 unnamed protein product [Didymodactylos carnosus]